MPYVIYRWFKLAYRFRRPLIAIGSAAFAFWESRAERKAEAAVPARIRSRFKRRAAARR